MWRKALFSALLLGLAAAVSMAQEACEIVLRNAERAYQEGRVEEVLAVHEVCTRGKARREQRIRAYTLLAKVYVVLDDMPRARNVVSDLLALDSEFKTDERDPIHFVRLLEEVRAVEALVTVASVSKTKESLREAPATVNFPLCRSSERSQDDAIAALCVAISRVLPLRRTSVSSNCALASDWS